VFVRPIRPVVLLVFLALVVGAGEAAPPQSAALQTPSVVAGLPPAQRADNRFRNLDPNYHRASIWARARSLIVGGTWLVGERRVQPLERVAPDIQALRGNTNRASVTWIGHSTLLVQLDGVNFLTDPTWSARSGPFGGFVGVGRYTPPAVALDDLPRIDFVLISHDHYDHLDVDTVQRLAQLYHPLFLVPLGLKAWFADLGITDVEELDWWENRQVHGLTVTCLPAQHFSGRTLWDRNRRLWSAWAVAGEKKRFFFAGDTGYYSGLTEIGLRLGPFDLAAIPIGAYLPPAMMKMTHITPEEALQLFADIKGERFVAMHWGTFDLTEEPVEEPPLRLEAEARRLGLDLSKVWVMKHGETRGW